MDVETPTRGKKRLKKMHWEKEGRFLWMHPEKPRTRVPFSSHMGIIP
jgi:hypothetical protein